MHVKYNTAFPIPDTRVYTAENHANAVAKLSACGIPFREVTLRTADGPKSALELHINIYIMIQAGQFLTDN